MYSDPSGYEVEKPYHKDISNPGVLCVYLISAWAIMFYELDMNVYEIAKLTAEVGDVGDLFYVVEVMYNGKLEGAYKNNPDYINDKEFYVCKAFTNKYVCKEVAKWYTWVGDGNTEKDIAQEIYSHAMAYYYYGNVKSIIGEDLTNEILIHSNPINLGGSRTVDKALKGAYNIIWYTSIGNKGGK